MNKILLIILMLISLSVAPAYGMAAAAPLPHELKLRYFDAVRHDNWDGIETCLSLRKELIDERDEWGQTALMIAAERGQFAAVKLLLDHDADPFLRMDDGKSALTLAIQWPFRLDVIHYLVNVMGIDRDPAKWRDELGTCLLIAAHIGHVDAVKFLIALGAPINWRDRVGQTPLMAAATFNMAGAEYEKIVAFHILERQGADVYARDKWGRTALYFSKLALADVAARPDPYSWHRITSSLRHQIRDLMPYEERRTILAALLACDELGCAKDKDFPPEYVCAGGPLKTIIKDCAYEPAKIDAAIAWREYFVRCADREFPAMEKQGAVGVGKK